MLLSLTIELSILSSILVLQSVDRNIGNVIKPGRNQPEMDPQLITRLTTSFYIASLSCAVLFFFSAVTNLYQLLHWCLEIVWWLICLHANIRKFWVRRTLMQWIVQMDGSIQQFSKLDLDTFLLVQRIWYIGWIEYRFSSSEDRLDVLNGIAP